MRPLIKLFATLLAPTARRFHHALENPQGVQRSLQEQILSRLVQSEYGKSLNIRSLADWDSIPIVDYNNIEMWIERQKDSKSPLFTPEPILFYERTSGSRGAAKFIPYTKSLRKSFSSMFCVWAHDLIVNGAAFSTGKIYFCISPQLGQPVTTSSGVPVGLEDDAEYLDGWLRWFLSLFLVSPAGINRLSDGEAFKEKLSQALLLEEKLEIISIWSPSFLTIHLDYIQTHQKQLAEQLKNRLSTKRYKLLLEPSIPWNEIWSELKLISCWDSVNAADTAAGLRSLFPNVMVQGKGLLATEAPMTVPLIKANGCVPVLDEVFFEFEDSDGKIHQLHEVEKGGIYEIILSQKGGLYRYRIGDRIRVTHFYHNTPCLEFLGRRHTTSDLVGEKLHSDFVLEVIKALGLKDTFFKSLVPVLEPTPHYVLLLDKVERDADAIALLLDEELMRSYHYRHARILGQLAPARVLVSPQIADLVTTEKTQSGKKWGDIKYDILVTTPLKTLNPK